MRRRHPSERACALQVQPNRSRTIWRSIAGPAHTATPGCSFSGEIDGDVTRPRPVVLDQGIDEEQRGAFQQRVDAAQVGSSGA
jgi:hypothetical protein